MAKVKAGLIMRTDVRSVTCPECGALPGVFCATLDKREHAGRTTAALAKQDAPAVGADEVRSQSQPVPVSATPSAPQPTPSDIAALKDRANIFLPPGPAFDAAVARAFPNGLPDPAPFGTADEPEAFATLKDFDAAVGRTLEYVALGAQPSLVGSQVRLIVTHGPQVVYDGQGTLVHLDLAQRFAEIRPGTTAPTVIVQWGANDVAGIHGL